MIRRNARLRREYLYRKNLEGKERAIYERKKKIKECLAGMLPNVALVRHLSKRLVQRGRKSRLN